MNKSCDRGALKVTRQIKWVSMLGMKLNKRAVKPLKPVAVILLQACRSGALMH